MGEKEMLRQFSDEKLDFAFCKFMGTLRYEQMKLFSAFLFEFCMSHEPHHDWDAVEALVGDRLKAMEAMEESQRV